MTTFTLLDSPLKSDPIPSQKSFNQFLMALGRSGYFAPGRKITSVALGLDAREWARARAGNPDTEARARAGNPDTEARLGARGALAVFKPIDAAMPK